MRPRSDYKICEYCGATLDTGERCDCKQDEVKDFERSTSNGDTSKRADGRRRKSSYFEWATGGIRYADSHTRY